MSSATTEQHNETADPRAAQLPTASGATLWVVSLLFWFTLLISVMMYALVALSPKLAEWIQVRQQYTENAARLVQLEEHVDYLERVATTLRSDPEFALRLAEASIPGRSTGKQLVPVTAELLFGGVTAQPTDIRQVDSPSQIVHPIIADIVQLLASSQHVRHWVMALSAALTLISFALLNESGGNILKAFGQLIVQVTSRIAHRYFRTSINLEDRKTHPETTKLDDLGSIGIPVVEVATISNNCTDSEVKSLSGLNPLSN